MSGLLHPDDPIDAQNSQTRYKYSTAHQDVAVCCVPNAGRIYPYYVKAMWMRSRDGLAATLYGACVLQTEVNGVAMRIVQETYNPFELEMTFRVEVAPPVEAELAFRKPAWANGFSLQGVSDWCEGNGLIKIRKTWQTGEKIALRLETEIRANPFRDGEYFMSYGPLVFALQLDYQEKSGRNYPLGGYRDLYYFPENNAVPEYLLFRGQDFRLEQGTPDQEYPWDMWLALVGSMVYAPTYQTIPVRLTPFGGSILRKTTFRLITHDGFLKGLIGNSTQESTNIEM